VTVIPPLTTRASLPAPTIKAKKTTSGSSPPHFNTLPLPPERPAQPFGAEGAEPNTVDAGIDDVGAGGAVNTLHPASDKVATMQFMTRQFMASLPPGRQ
jgi:hypothetical protein